MKGTMESKEMPFTKRGRLQIVPWYNKKEWEETYKQAYSDDIDLQEKAYTQMSIWKTRCSNLPMGVECTMSVLHVRLCDKQTGATPYRHRDLQLLYSTAVMSFLNHLSVLSNCKDSMYKMAEQNQIPDWLINLRHQAAHGNSAPALYLLRQASDIILQWLRDNYWEVEQKEMTDFVSDEEERRESYCKTIKELLELWVLLKINYWSCKRTIDKIPDEEIRFKEIAMELAKEEGVGIKRSSVKGVEVSPDKLDSSIFEEEGMVLGEDEEYTHKIKTAFKPLLKRLFDPLNGKPHVRSLYRECLIDCLVTFEGFCPQIGQHNLTELELSQLMWLQWQLWEGVLLQLEDYRLLHCLMSGLRKQGISGHMWLRLFTLLLTGDPPPPPKCRGGQDVCLVLAESLPCQVEPQVLLSRIKLKQSIHLKPPTAKDIQVLREHAQEVVYAPSPFTVTYLKSLLKFWDDGLRPENVELLVELSQIYTGTQLRTAKPQKKVFTVASLIDQGLVISDSEDDNSRPPPDISPWAVYSGDADWSKCPLGTLPWQL